MNHDVVDYISPEAVFTLDGLFHERVKRSPDGIAYRYFDEQTGEWCELTWLAAMQEVVRWQQALMREGLAVGDRVAIMLKNCPAWVAFDQAALGLGLVTVPLYVSDRPENVAHVLQDSEAKLLLVHSTDDWHPIRELDVNLSSIQRVVSYKTPPESGNDSRIKGVDEWLLSSSFGEFQHLVADADALATIVYTSGTTGKSKGVMLTHGNIMQNAWGSLVVFTVYPHDVFLSFLPLSHALERMAGYCLPIMSGASVAFARSVQQLQEDLASVRPTIIVTVPRIFERIQLALRSKLEKSPAYARCLFEWAVTVGYSRFEYEQGRGRWRWCHLFWPILKKLVASKLQARLGGRLRLAVAGGAALSADSARTFIGLGVPIAQGYGLTETSPVISVNHAENNVPTSVGHVLQGVQVRLGESDGLEVRGPNVMQGYWNNKEANEAIFTDDGWLKTGDVAKIDATGRITITGRIKEIIVLSNGEKVPPADIEAAILRDTLFEQVMLVGEGKPYLGLLAVVNHTQWQELANEHHLSSSWLPSAWPDALNNRQANTFALSRVAAQMKAFPGYAKVRKIALLHEAWTVENGLLTPTLKIKRHLILQQHQAQYEQLYENFKLS
ncbi:MAG: long-chain fatty acid--CoA ligase [Methylotenera sp.]|nr:long-chain fatty acid--CoA ligase [Methylotenera sp.]